MNVQKVFRYTVLVFGVLIFTVGLFRLNPFLTFMSVLYLVLMSKILDMEPDEYSEFSMNTLKRDLFVWCFFPMVLGAIGTTQVIDEYFFFIFLDLAYMTLAAILAFMLMIVLNYHTDFRPDRKLVIFFIVIFTIAAGTVTGIIRYYIDIYLGTIYLGGNTYLMAYLTMVTILGIAIGLNIEDYICHYEFFPLEDMDSDLTLKADMTNDRKEFLKFLNMKFHRYEWNYLIVLSRFLQAGILVTVVYGFLTENLSVFSWSVFSLIVALSPDLFSIKTDTKAPAVLYLWIGLATFIFAVGRSLGFYGRFDNWAGITHMLTGTLIGVLVFSLMQYLNHISKNIYIPEYMIVAIVLISIFPVGVIWEIAEFQVDVFFDKNLQAGIKDTVHDLLCNFVGASISVFMAYFLERNTS